MSEMTKKPSELKRLDGTRLDGNNRQVGVCICGRTDHDVKPEECHHFINHISIYATSGKDGGYVIVQCGACKILWRYWKGTEVEYKLYVGFVDKANTKKSKAVETLMAAILELNH